MSDNIEIHPSQFENFACRVMEVLMDTHVIPDDIGTAQYDRGVNTVMRLLRFQKNVHDTWEPGQEETIKRFRMNVAESTEPPRRII